MMILIVDDDRDCRRALAHLLRFAGHESVSVGRGIEAIEMLQYRKPELMIVDVNMPEMDGITVLKKIREHEELSELKVIMYSGMSSDEVMAEAFRLGAADYFVKGTAWFDYLVARISEVAGDHSKPN